MQQMPSLLDIDRLDADHPARQVPLRRMGDITDPTLWKHPPQRHSQRPGHHKIAQRRLVKNKYMPANHADDDDA